MSIAVEPDEIPASLSEPFIRLARDMKQAAATLGRREARWLVDIYYQIQNDRIRAAHQERMNAIGGEPHRLIGWVCDTMERFEGAIKGSLGVFAASYATGQWMQAQYGIGPVLSAALLAHFDIRKAQTVGHYWRFAGLDPTCKWEKGQKRPWNAKLKAICAYRMGECFVKFQNRDECFYGHLLAAKKAALAADNAAGKFAGQAAAEIARCQATKSLLKAMETTERWKHWLAGHLCPANIHDRARRWTVKLFLSHLHHVSYWDFYGKDPPAPYVFDHPELGDHRHLITPPLWPGEYDGKKLSEMAE